MKTTICCQSAAMGSKALHGDAHQQRHRRHLRRGREEGGDRRRRALVDVRRPHVERHGRDLEGEAGEHEDEAEDQAELALAPGLSTGGDAREADLAGEAVDQRGAVEQHARRQRAEDEIFQAGFGRAQRVAVDRGEHVERQRLQLEAEIEREHVARRDHQHHAERGKHDEDGILELVELLGLGEADRHDERDQRAAERQQLHEAREGVDDEGAAEGLAVAGPSCQIRRRRPREHGDREPGDERASRARRRRRRSSGAPWRRSPGSVPASPASGSEISSAGMCRVLNRSSGSPHGGRLRGRDACR